MNIKIILLANSRKLGGRCLAGIEVEERVAGRFTLVLNNGMPKWVRPISNGLNGEVSVDDAKKYQNLEIIELFNVRPNPQGFQSENVLVDGIRSIQKTQLSEADLNLLCDSLHNLIFSNRGRAVVAESINELCYSLMMVKPSKFEAYETLNARGVRQMRGKFLFNGNEYDFPVTDACYDIDAKNGGVVFLALSIGLEFEGWHSKLIAGVHFV